MLVLALVDEVALLAAGHALVALLVRARRIVVLIGTAPRAPETSMAVLGGVSKVGAPSAFLRWRRARSRSAPTCRMPAPVLKWIDGDDPRNLRIAGGLVLAYSISVPKVLAPLAGDLGANVHVVARTVAVEALQGTESRGGGS